MSTHVVFLSVPGLRSEDVERMPHLQQLVRGGDRASLTHSFPAVTWPSQAAMLTGKTPAEHGVVANGFFWRDTNKVEMWTAWNDKILAPQIWDVIRERGNGLTSAAWFPMLSKGCGADYICMPAPIHNPDGSESLWCYTRPTEDYGPLRDALGHFPLKHFWGPLANIQSTGWIADSAVLAAQQYQPNFFYIYLPHLDYAAQKLGPDSDAAISALGELDNVLQRLADGFHAALDGEDIVWIVASEYVITPVDHVCYPNRLLRDAGLLTVDINHDGEQLDFANTPAWALVDHQFSHVFVKDSDPNVCQRVADLFTGETGIAEVLVGDDRKRYHMDHSRSGDVILVSEPNSWQAYYWWLDDTLAPSYARTVDIHRKPGYDPVEMHLDMATRSTPLDATLIGGSHGAPTHQADQQGVLLTSQSGTISSQTVADTDLFQTVLQRFDIQD